MYSAFPKMQAWHLRHVHWQVKVVSAPPAGKGRIFMLLARQNVSLDEEYARRKAKKGALMAFRHKHAVSCGCTLLS